MSKMENTFYWSRAKGGGVTKEYVDTQDAKLGVRIDGSVTIATPQTITSKKTFSGGIDVTAGTTDFKNNYVTGVPNPGSNSDATNRSYVDTQDNKSVKLLGSQDIAGNKNFLNYTKFTDGINMNSLRIQFLGTPTGTTDAANKSYVDAETVKTKAYADTMQHPDVPFMTKTGLGFTVGGPWKVNARFMESSTAADFEIDAKAVLVMSATMFRKNALGTWDLVSLTDVENRIFYTGTTAPQPLKYRVTAKAGYELDIRLYVVYTSQD